MRLLLAPIWNVVLFCINMFKYKSFVRKKWDLAIIQEDTIFARILSISRTELSLYSVCTEGTARHKIDMAWLNRSPILVGRRGDLLVQMISTCLPGS